MRSHDSTIGQGNSLIFRIALFHRPEMTMIERAPKEAENRLEIAME
jgi:hypothetical protein